MRIRFDTAIAIINDKLLRKYQGKQMNWLEIIQVRSGHSNLKVLEEKIETMFSDMIDKIKNQTIKSYSRMLVETDFCIHIFHDSKKVENRGSPLGLRLASALKNYGLVNHSIWIETSGK